MEVIKAQPVHNLDDDDENYKMSFEIIKNKLTILLYGLLYLRC